jgi:hypothetical protein
MGGAKSKSSAEIVNETVAQVLVSNANDCSASVSGIQIVRTSGLTLGQLNYASMRLSQSCIQNITITNDLVEKITNAIDQQARAKVTAILPGVAISKNKTVIRNAVATNITNATMQKAMASLQFGQDIGTSGVTIGQANVITGDVALKAMQTAVSNTNLAREIGATVGQDSGSETDTSPISQIFGGIWGWIAIIVIIFIIIAGGIVALNYFGSSSSAVLTEPVGDQMESDEYVDETEPNLDNDSNLVNQQINDLAVNQVQNVVKKVLPAQIRA